MASVYRVGTTDVRDDLNVPLYAKDLRCLLEDVEGLLAGDVVAHAPQHPGARGNRWQPELDAEDDDEVADASRSAAELGRQLLELLGQVGPRVRVTVRHGHTVAATGSACKAHP